MSEIILGRHGTGLTKDNDPQDKNYPLRMRALPVKRKTKRWAFFDYPLDQGFTGTCVGHAFKHFLSAAPIIQSDVDARPTAFEIYVLACRLDPWRENDNGDLMFGTSMNAGAKALRQMGYIERWEHSYDVNRVADFLAGVDANGKHIGGPVLLGLPWLTGMYRTDANGYVWPTGREDGGHALACFMWNEKRGEFWGPNSWGNYFGKPHRRRGQDGYWRMTGETMETLFDMGGEAIICHEVRKAA